MFHPRAFLKGKRGTRGLEQNRRDASPGPPSDGRKWPLAEIEKVRPGDHLLRLDHVPAHRIYVRRGIMGTHEAASASHRGQVHRAGMVASYRAEAKKAAAAARAASVCWVACDRPWEVESAILKSGLRLPLNIHGDPCTASTAVTIYPAAGSANRQSVGHSR